MNRVSSNLSFYIVGLSAVLLLAIFSLLFQNGSIIGQESQWMLLNYLDERTLAQKVFDVGKNDNGFYQARELSYLFDLLDANILKLSAHLDMVHFYSATYYAGITIISLLFLYTARTFFHVKSVAVSSLLTALFMTSPVIFFSGTYFRTSKILVAVFLALIIVILLQLKRSKKYRSSLLLLLSVASFFMALSDRQGYFFVLTLTILSFITSILGKHKLALLAFASFIASAAASSFYTYLLGPSIIEKVTGTRPSLIYLRMDFYDYGRQIPPGGYSEIMQRLLGLSVSSVELLLDTVGYFWGSMSTEIVAAAVVTLIVIVVRTLPQSTKTIALLSVAFFFTVSFILIYLMSIKNDLIFLPETRRIYYTVPIMTFLLFLSGFLISLFLKQYPDRKWLIVGIVSVMLLSNIVQMESHYAQIRNSKVNKYYRVFEVSETVKKCIRQENQPITDFWLWYPLDKVCKKLRNI